MAASYANSAARIFVAAPKTPFRVRVMLDGEFLSFLRVPIHEGAAVSGVFAALGWRRLREQQHRTVASKWSPLGVWREARRKLAKSTGWGVLDSNLD